VQTRMRMIKLLASRSMSSLFIEKDSTMKLSQFLRENKKNLTDYGLSGLGSLVEDYLTEPESLLHKAERKLLESDDFSGAHKLLTKSIETQTVSLLNKLGIKEPQFFSEQISLVNKLGILAPRILVKIEGLHKCLEAYEKKAKLENQLDITSLYIKITKRFMNNFFQDFEMRFDENNPNWNKVNESSWLGSAKHGFKIIFHEKGRPHIQAIGVVDYSEVMNYRINSSKRDYIHLLRAFISLSLWDVHPDFVFEKLCLEVLEVA
jgi:hypothetical protein